MFSYNGSLQFGLVGTRNLEDLQSLADRIVVEFNKLESSVAHRRG